MKYEVWITFRSQLHQRRCLSVGRSWHDVLSCQRIFIVIFLTDQDKNLKRQCMRDPGKIRYMQKSYKVWLHQKVHFGLSENFALVHLIPQLIYPQVIEVSITAWFSHGMPLKHCSIWDPERDQISNFTNIFIFTTFFHILQNPLHIDSMDSPLLY